MMKKIINLTPHEITILVGEDKMVIPSSGVARAASTRTKIGEINGISINKTTFGQVEGLPEQKEDTIYIVSALTAQAVPERDDVFITDDAVRDNEGRILGCRALAHI